MKTKSNSAAFLPELAQEINDHDKAKRACKVKGVMHGLKIGELLIKAKAIVPHGKFMAWVEANTSVSQRMAQMYMTLAKSDRITVPFICEYETVSHLTINKAVKLTRQHERVEKYRDECFARIVALENQSDSNLREMADSLDTARQTFKEDGGDQPFQLWLAQETKLSEPLVEAIPGLLDAGCDYEGWSAAFIADLEFRLDQGDSFDWFGTTQS